MLCKLNYITLCCVFVSLYCILTCCVVLCRVGYACYIVFLLFVQFVSLHCIVSYFDVLCCVVLCSVVLCRPSHAMLLCYTVVLFCDVSIISSTKLEMKML